MVEQENVITKCEDAFCFIGGGGGHVCRVGWLITPHEVLAMKKNALTSCISVLPKHYDNKLKPLIMVTSQREYLQMLHIVYATWTILWYGNTFVI